MDLVVLPEGATVETWYINGMSMSSSAETAIKNQSAQVAIVGNEIYVAPFYEDFPTSWIKGTLKGNYVTFPKGQYLGKYNTIDIWYMGAATNEFGDPYEHNANAKTITFENDIFANADAKNIRYVAWYRDVVLSAKEASDTHFQVNGLWYNIISEEDKTVEVSKVNVNYIIPLNHNYVLVCDDYTENGTGTRVKGTFWGGNHFLDVIGGSVATGKGSATLGDARTLTPLQGQNVEALAAKYAQYNTPQLNSLRLKNNQDIISMTVKAGSKIIFIGQGNNGSGPSARIPKIATDVYLNNTLNAAPDADFPATVAGYVYEWTADADRTIYVGSYNGDMYLSYIVVEANNNLGAPMLSSPKHSYSGDIVIPETVAYNGTTYRVISIGNSLVST